MKVGVNLLPHGYAPRILLLGRSLNAHFAITTAYVD